MGSGKCCVRRTPNLKVEWSKWLKSIRKFPNRVPGCLVAVCFLAHYRGIGNSHWPHHLNYLIPLTFLHLQNTANDVKVYASTTHTLEDFFFFSISLSFFQPMVSFDQELIFSPGPSDYVSLPRHPFFNTERTEGWFGPPLYPKLPHVPFRPTTFQLAYTLVSSLLGNIRLNAIPIPLYYAWVLHGSLTRYTIRGTCCFVVQFGRNRQLSLCNSVHIR